MTTTAATQTRRLSAAGIGTALLVVVVTITITVQQRGHGKPPPPLCLTVQHVRDVITTSWDTQNDPLNPKIANEFHTAAATLTSIEQSTAAGALKDAIHADVSKLNDWALFMHASDLRALVDSYDNGATNNAVLALGRCG